MKRGLRLQADQRGEIPRRLSHVEAPVQDTGARSTGCGRSSRNGRRSREDEGGREKTKYRVCVGSGRHVHREAERGRGCLGKRTDGGVEREKPEARRDAKRVARLGDEEPRRKFM